MWILHSQTDALNLAIALGFLATAFLAIGKIEEANRASKEFVNLANKLNDELILSSALNITGRVEALANGNFAEALALQNKACKPLKEKGSRWSYAKTVYGLAA